MSEKRFGGMTVNGRLFEAGLLDEFDSAVRQEDKQGATALLEHVELSHKQARETVSLLLANPSKYGY